MRSIKIFFGSMRDFPFGISTPALAWRSAMSKWTLGIRRWLHIRFLILPIIKKRVKEVSNAITAGDCEIQLGTFFFRSTDKQLADSLQALHGKKGISVYTSCEDYHEKENWYQTTIDFS